MHPDPPTWYSIMHRSKHEPQVRHHLQSTYFNSDPSERPSIDGAAGSSMSKVGLMNAPKPLPPDLSCDCTNSAKYTLSPLYFNRTADGNEARSINAAKVKVGT